MNPHRLPRAGPPVKAIQTLQNHLESVFEGEFTITYPECNNLPLLACTAAGGDVVDVTPTASENIHV